MSADDFQSKYASVMESMLKSAVAETTKLFETMVDELKAEISRIKKENEDLKTRCSQFENGKSQTTAVESEPPPRLSDRSEKRDTAVQCDLVPFRTMLVEQCQPPRNSSLQNQPQQSYEEKDYGLREHNYGIHGEGNSQTDCYDDSSLQSVLTSCGEVSNAGLPQTATCGTENEGPLIDQEHSTGEMPKKYEADLELPHLAGDESSQAVQDQSSGPKHSEDNTEGGLVSTEEQPVMTAEELSVVEAVEKQQPSVAPEQCQREVDTVVNELADVSPQQHAEPFEGHTQQNKVAHGELKDGIAEASSGPVSRRRGRPPKKRKHLQEPVKDVLESPATVVATLQDEVNYPTVMEKVGAECPQAPPVKLTNTSSIITPSEKERVNTAMRDVGNSKIGSLPISTSSLTMGCSAEKEKTGETQQLAPYTEVSSASETVNSTAEKSQQEQSDHHRPRRTSVTLQDAMLLVEAMNRSSEENGSLYSPKRTAEPPQSPPAPHGYTLQTVDEILAEPLKKVQLPVQTLEASGSLFLTGSAAQPQQMIKILGAYPKVTNSTQTNKAQAHMEDGSKRQHIVTHYLDTVTRPLPSSTAAGQTNPQSQQHHPHLLKTYPAPSETSNVGPHKIIVVPRLVPSLIHHKIASLSPSRLPTFMSTVMAPQNHILPPPAAIPHTTPSLCPQKTIHVSSRNMLPIVLSKSTDQQLGVIPPQKMRITVPRYVPPVVSRTILLTREQASAKPATAVKVSSIPMMSLTQELTASVVAKTLANADYHSKSPKQTSSVSETTNEPTETCSSLKMSVPAGKQPGLVSPTQQKLSPMVRLTKLPFSVSMKESVLVSSELPNRRFETPTLLNEGTQVQVSSMVISTQPPEMPVVSTNICPSLNDKCVSEDTSQISEEQNNFQEMALSSSETRAVLEEPPTMVMAPEKSTEAVSKTEPSASNFMEEEISNTDQDCVQPNEANTEDKQPSTPIQLTPITPKDTPDPGLQITKTQFLAQLAVLPVVQGPEKASPKDCADKRASSSETCTGGKKRLEENSLVARLRSHLKNHSQARRTKTNPEASTETDTSTVSPNKLVSDPGKVNEVTPISSKKPGMVEDFTTLNKTTNGSTSIGSRRTGLCKDAVRPKRSVSEPTSRSTTESSPRRVYLGRDCAGTKSTKSTYSSLNPKSAGLTSDSVSLKQTKSTSVSPKRLSSTRESGHHKSSAVSSSTSRSIGTCTNPRLSSPELISLNRKRSTITQDNSSIKKIKRESSAFSPKRRTTTSVRAKIETCSPVVTCSKLSKQGVSPRQTAESPHAKKLGLVQDGTTPKKSTRLLNAKKLAKAAKAKSIAKMKKSNLSKLQSGTKTSRLAENQAGCESVKKLTTKAVWIPPRIPASKTPSAGGKRPKLTRSPKSQNLKVVYPPSHTLSPIPVKAPPIVSPLQPLSVIGGRLLKHQCGECGRVLSSSAALESHVSLHTGRRPFSCTLCGKSFPDSKGLKRHGRVHRNGRIHNCQQCGKGFVYRFGLTKHLQMVHSKIKPFVCQVCNKGFFTKRDVEAHIRIHTGEKPFHCNLCEKKFTRRVELNVHLRWHNGEKRHWCPYCGKGFLDLNNLKRHKYIHTGEKPHSCPHCPKHFKQSGHLKKHVKNVHKIQ